MRLLVIGVNYAPESTSYTADLCEDLVRQGHFVQVITAFPIVPSWKIWPEYRGRRFMRETINAVPLLRSYIYVPDDPSRARSRILFDTSFSLSAFASSWVMSKPDLIMAVLPPLQMGFLLWITSLFKRAPLFLHLQDIVPDVAVATGALRKDSIAVKASHALERLTYARAKSIGVICDGFAQNLTAKGVPADKIKVLPNWVDLDVIQPGRTENEFRRAHGLSAGDFVVMYSGSVSVKQGLETLVEAAALLRETPSIRFVIIGEGPRLEAVKAFAEQRSLRNMLFLPFQPKEQLSLQLSAANALAICQQASVTDAVLPGKLATYFASARPVVASVNERSETARYVRKGKAGLVVQPESAADLAAAVLRLQADREYGDQLGRNGRQFAEQYFDRRRALDRFAAHLEQIAGR